MVEVRQECVMSLWLFNMYMEDYFEEVQARTLEKDAQLVGDGEENMK